MSSIHMPTCMHCSLSCAVLYSAACNKFDLVADMETIMRKLESIIGSPMPLVDNASCYDILALLPKTA